MSPQGLIFESLGYLTSKVIRMMGKAIRRRPKAVEGGGGGVML